MRLRRARRLPGLYRGGAAPPPEPPRFFFRGFGRARLGANLGAPMYRIPHFLDDYVTSLRGVPSGEAGPRRFS